MIKGVYPASPSSWLFVVIAILATMYMRSDPSMGLITKIQQHLPLRYTDTPGLFRETIRLLLIHGCNVILLRVLHYQLLCVQQQLCHSKVRFRVTLMTQFSFYGKKL